MARKIQGDPIDKDPIDPEEQLMQPAASMWFEMVYFNKGAV